MSRLDFEAEINDFCSSHQFLLLDGGLKPHVESVLHYWAQTTEPDITAQSIENSLKNFARLVLPLEVRKAVPRILGEFFTFIGSTGRVPQAAQWAGYALQAHDRYLARLRDDGSVRGETFRKRCTDVGRNDPCPCGSGQKFKKCCMKLIA